MNRSDRYSDLADIAKHTSYKQIFDLFHIVASCRYCTFKHLHAVNHRVGNKKHLVNLVELGYLSLTDNKVFFTTPKTWYLLQAEGYNTDIIHKTLEAKAPEHELDITTALLNIYKEPDFYAVIYPHFVTLIPDACIVYKKDDAHKIVFLEVENEKPGWENYLNEKKKKYEELGRNEEVYTVWWKKWHSLLKLPYCSIDQFSFSYRVVKNGR